MNGFKRIFFFFLVNAAIVCTLSFILSLLDVGPYLTAYGLDFESLAIFCSVWGMGGAIISLLISKRLAIWLVGVKLIDRNSCSESQAQLYDTVAALAQRARLPEIPEVGIFSNPNPNAFATGRSSRSSLVAVSSALLQELSPDEVEAVLAHEISHIVNGDMVTMTLLQGIMNAFVMFLSRVAAFMLTRSNRKSKNADFYQFRFFTFLFENCLFLLGSLVTCAFSRMREYRADRGSADLVGADKMIRALEQLRRCAPVKNAKAASSFQAFMIRGKESSWLSLFSTHPSIDKRIAALQGDWRTCER